MALEGAARRRRRVARGGAETSSIRTRVASGLLVLLLAVLMWFSPLGYYIYNLRARAVQAQRVHNVGQRRRRRAATVGRGAKDDRVPGQDIRVDSREVVRLAHCVAVVVDLH